MKDSSCSYFHPKEGVGVCPLCLNDRLLILASTTSSATHRFGQPVSHIKSPNFFAFTSLLNRLQFKHSKSQTSYDPDDAASTPQAGNFSYFNIVQAGTFTIIVGPSTSFVSKIIKTRKIIQFFYSQSTTGPFFHVIFC